VLYRHCREGPCAEVDLGGSKPRLIDLLVHRLKRKIAASVLLNRAPSGPQRLAGLLQARLLPNQEKPWCLGENSFMQVRQPLAEIARLFVVGKCVIQRYQMTDTGEPPSS